VSALMTKYREMLARYRERMQHQHAWEVELTCPACGFTGLPVFHGWTPSNAVNFGKKATIYANLTCPQCQADLKEAAAKKLVELFADVAVPPRNRQVMARFLAVTLGIPLLLAVGLFLGVWAGWWSGRAFVILTPLSMVFLPFIFWLNWQVASLRYQCECGQPAYKFMGLLGRSYGYRCSTCGKLLRLRD